MKLSAMALLVILIIWVSIFAVYFIRFLIGIFTRTGI